MKLSFRWLKKFVNHDVGRKIKTIVVKGSFISAFFGVVGLVGVFLWWNNLLANTAANQQQMSENSLFSTLESEKNTDPQAEDQRTEDQKTADQAAMAGQGDGVTEDADKRVLTIEDFPDPVRAEPVKEAGNYYSEVLKAYLFHAGRDYLLEEGTVIRANFGGTVTYAGEDFLLGQRVSIDCGQGWELVFGGLDNLRVKAGDKVNQNDIIGQIGYYPGAEGEEGKTRLHYELWLGNVVMTPVNSAE